MASKRADSEQRILGLPSPGWVATLGGVIGSALPFLSPVPGALAGAIAGGAIEAVLPNIQRLDDVCLRFLDSIGLSLHASIFRKLRHDLDLGVLSSDESIAHSQARMLTNLVAAGLLPSTLQDLRIPASVRNGRIPFISPSAYRGLPTPENIDLLKTLRNLQINAQSVHLGVLAALRVMRDQYGLPITVVNEWGQVPATMKVINERQREYDVIFIAAANMFLLGNDHARHTYRYLLPVHWTRQFLVKPKGHSTTDARRLIYAEGSSGEEQMRIHKDLLSARVEPHKVAFESIVNALAELEPGQALLGWEPFLSFNNRRLRHRVFPVKQYSIGISMFCHDKWLRYRERRKVLNAFTDTFVAAWNASRFSSFESAVALASSSEVRRHFLVSLSQDQTDGLASLVEDCSAFLRD